MNKKLLATAVAATLVSPIAMADVTAYGRINNALQHLDRDELTDSSLDIRNVSSRIGLRGSAELENGMTARAQYEFATATDVESTGILDTRVAIVGLAGDFGSVDIGNQWSAYYLTVGTHLDPTYTVGAVIYSSFARAPYRASNTIKYANTWGPVYLELDTRFSNDANPPVNTEKIGADNGKDGLDGYGIGISITPVENLIIAVAFDNELFEFGSDDERAAAAVSYSFGDHRFVVGYQDGDFNDGISIESTAFYYHGSAGANSWMVGYQGGDGGLTGSEIPINVEPSQIILGFYHSLGNGFRLYYEGTFVDTDVDSFGLPSTDFSDNNFGFRYDF